MFFYPYGFTMAPIDAMKQEDELLKKPFKINLL